MSAMQPEPIDPIDAWNALVDLGDFIDLDEAERTFALSPEALAAEVAASGYTLEGKPLEEVPGAAPSERLRKEGVTGGQSGAVVVVQRTSSDLKLHPHLHVLFLDGAYAERESGVSFTELPRLSTHEVGEVLARVVARIVKHLCRHGLLDALEGAGDADGDDESDGLTALAASAASGRSPPAGPEWRRKATPLAPLPAAALRYDKPLCASQDGFTLHAATRAGAMDTVGREALCRYVLRPPIAQERVTHGPTAS